ncbi:MDR family MFS transporter [Dactylosporangium fulvum]|uniref:MFS transporter n=1 Tax=Dactylosporangium fulvum TaxID=53359 RepID=A0ABY5VNI0_9ACTN|nr:MDR family MFS transporter [Dactylosporangium fulvum]UWP79030.1 MFS transporter [Dactylosporangium fulvum]
MSRSLYVGLAGVVLGMITAPLDGMMLGPALPVIVADLGGLEHFSWVVTAYLVATATATPIWGKLGDLYGRKRVYLAAIVLFLLGSALSGAARDMTQLIGFRAVQGLGGGGLMVGALALIAELVPPRRSGRLMGLFGAMMPVAFIAGPLLGGLFADHLSWRWTFYVNLPVGLVAVLLIATTVPGSRQRTKARIDVPGVLLLTVALVALSLLASWGGNRYAWVSAPIVLLAVVSAGALAAFVAVERRAAEPVVPLRLYGNRNFTLAQVLRFLAGAGMMVPATFLPQYMQLVKGASATASGMLILPAMLGMVVVLIGSGQLISRTGRYRAYPILGGALLTGGMLVLLLLGPGTGVALASALTLLVGAGVGLLMQSTTIITINSAPPRDMGSASGSVTLWHTMGASLGAAGLGALYADRLRDTLGDRGGTTGAVHAAVTSGVHAVVLAGAALGVVAFALAWLIHETPLREQPAPAPVLEETLV